MINTRLGYKFNQIVILFMSLNISKHFLFFSIEL